MILPLTWLQEAKKEPELKPALKKSKPPSEGKEEKKKKKEVPTPKPPSLPKEDVVVKKAKEVAVDEKVSITNPVVEISMRTFVVRGNTPVG